MFCRSFLAFRAAFEFTLKCQGFLAWAREICHCAISAQALYHFVGI